VLVGLVLGLLGVPLGAVLAGAHVLPDLAALGLALVVGVAEHLAGDLAAAEAEGEPIARNTPPISAA
jgi:hypothetical protein